jgi:hypothetical protein
LGESWHIALLLAEGMDHMIRLFAGIINFSCFAIPMIVNFFLETSKPRNLET